VQLETPIVVYPESLWRKEFKTHPAAGEGASWSKEQVAVSETGTAAGTSGKPQMRRVHEVHINMYTSLPTTKHNTMQ
jgi:hypothetical protein